MPVLCNVTIKGNGIISNQVWQKLNAIGLHNTNTGEQLPSISAYYNGLRITQKKDEFVIKNSLHKFSKNNNTGLFTLKECIESINKLSNFLEKDIWQCYIPKFEFGINISTSKNPNVYLQQMQGYKSKSIYAFDSSHRQQTLYFKTSDYKIKMYNKTQESNIESNVLRFEIERLNKAHYLPKMQTVKDVINPQSFKNLASEILKKFNQIQFQQQIFTTSKCSNLFLIQYFNSMGIAKAKKNLENNFGKKQANYYTNKFKQLNKTYNQTNKYQQELLQNLQYQLTQIFSSIPSL